MANRYGTISRVVGVANSSPPITARASAAFCSSPGPPIAIGIIPTIMAAAGISTARIPVPPAAPPILLVARAAERHRNHPDDHGSGGHQHRPDSRASGRDRRIEGADAG